MLHLLKKARTKVAQSPGNLTFIGESSGPRGSTITHLQYTEAQCRFIPVGEIEDLKITPDESSIHWINVRGLDNANVVEKIGQRFNIHPLTLEDILNTFQNPKIEEHEDYLYVQMKFLHWHPESGILESEHVGLVLRNNMVISFQEKPEDLFEPVVRRIQEGKGRIRGMKSDYLMYTLMDLVVDHFFLLLDEIRDTSESLEEEVLASPTQETVAAILRTKRQMILLKRSLRPLREGCLRLLKREHLTLTPDTTIFYRDLADHVLHILDLSETFHEVLSELYNLYITFLGNRSNEVMKVLTIIATFFIPITFIAGVYGMNFENIPELKWPLGYGLFWLITVLTTGGLFLFFKRKKWF